MLYDHVGLSASMRQRLVGSCLVHRTLEDVIRAGSRVVSVVTQDEYTHDVVVGWEGLFVVYDTT
ncbi:MAG: hypothetical protein HY791_05610 [Deltaproteobacteria bacterium]|nr:hypothetical protein [Deltaproteobacteria bacterium]